MEENLQFIIMVDTTRGRQDLLKLILGKFMDAVQRKSNSCDLRGNWIEIWENENAESRLSINDEEAYLYYKWRIEVTPLKDSIDETEQIQLAKDLLSCFIAGGCKAVVCANFEDKV